MGARFDERYAVRKGDVFTAEHFNLRYRDIDDRLVPLEAALVSWEYQATIVQDRVLARSEDVISVLRDKLVSLTQLQWLTATSGSSVVFVTGQSAQILVAADKRDLFTPGPFSVVSRTGDLTAYAIVRTVAYDRETGQWATNVEATFGDLSTAHTDWAIGAIAGSTLAQLAYLATGKTALADAIAARDTARDWATKLGAEVVVGGGFSAKKYAFDAVTQAGAAAGSAGAAAGSATASAGSASAASTSAGASAGSATGAAASAVLAQAWATKLDGEIIVGGGYSARYYAAAAKASADSIAAGPVVSVAGRTGVVTGDQLKAALALAIADVSGLAAALAGKATVADINTAIDALKGGAGAAYDTLIELQNIIQNDESVAAALATLVGQHTTQIAASNTAIAALNPAIVAARIFNARNFY